jgi:hypothetical protein
MSNFNDADIELVGNWYYMAWLLKYDFQYAARFYKTMIFATVGMTLLITGSILISSSGFGWLLAAMILVGAPLTAAGLFGAFCFGMQLTSTQCKSAQIQKVCEKALGAIVKSCVWRKLFIKRRPVLVAH